jgi:hypothetical protein
MGSRRHLHSELGSRLLYVIGARETSTAERGEALVGYMPEGSEK